MADKLKELMPDKAFAYSWRAGKNHANRRRYYVNWENGIDDLCCESHLTISTTEDTLGKQPKSFSVREGHGCYRKPLPFVVKQTMNSDGAEVVALYEAPAMVGVNLIVGDRKRYSAAIYVSGVELPGQQKRLSISKTWMGLYQRGEWDFSMKNWVSGAGHDPFKCRVPNWESALFEPRVWGATFHIKDIFGDILKNTKRCI